ncbi:IS30 family transposase, partial [Bacilli bacterium PM5-9]|nr:IS30 family transposase [Bacilli bacterium PM5-9]
YDTFKQEELIKIFYANPCRSDQKGKCEKNHVHIREIVPKGIDLQSYTTSDLNYISNQINNYPRKIFKYKSPIQLMKNLEYNEKILELNNLKEHPIQQVNLSRIIK